MQSLVSWIIAALSGTSLSLSLALGACIGLKCRGADDCADAARHEIHERIERDFEIVTDPPTIQSVVSRFSR